MSPRSILKRSSNSVVEHPTLTGALPYPPVRPQVHFPPTPSLTQTYPTHSGSMYDRAPIVVLPNDCALPERGCPGRTYDGYDARCKSKKGGVSSNSSSNNGKSMYPRAVEDNHNGWAMPGPSCAPTSFPFMPPPLVPDVSSSESDESDGVASPPPEYSGSAQGAAMQQYQYQYGPFMMSMPQEQYDKALAFLPHPPTSSAMSGSSNKELKKKSDKERKRTTSSNSSSARFKSNDYGRSSFASSSLELDGCLGGF